ncbi:MAG: superoxide dismutase family protein [Chloroflexia bacterium]|nr:superoxide dismutase family protein [Chloroflexia bacterium]
MFSSDRLRTVFACSALAATLAFAGVVAAQDGTPVISPSPMASPMASVSVQIALVDVEGNLVGTGAIAQSSGQVVIQISGRDIEPGEHGIHIHESGVCSAEGDMPFGAAGAHFNPTNASHGAPTDADAHAGDLGNLLVGDDGAYTVSIATAKVTLEPGTPNSLRDADGSALVIHANADDLMTDPTGNSGDRIACGIIYPSTTVGTPGAATPAATPAS